MTYGGSVRKKGISFTDKILTLQDEKKNLQKNPCYQNVK
jgi:hypothetical protein